MENKESIRKIAESVKKDSFNWVLVLGSGISWDGMKAADEEFADQILQLQRGAADQGGMRERVCKAVQERNHDAVMTALYGDIWNGVNFLRIEEEEQKRRRERYAAKFAVRNHINLECYTKLDMRALIRTFQGIILTTCQDEIIEAFLEDELCMTVKNQIYTPYTLATLPHWKKRLERSRALIKLHGTCTEPCRMLLSKRDMNMYYPEKEKPLHTVEALDWIFQNKNLLFLDMDLEDGRPEGKRTPALAPGIRRLLEKDITAHKNNADVPQRYIILEKEEEKTDRELYEKLHIRTINCQADGTSRLIGSLTQQIRPGLGENIHDKCAMEERAGREDTEILTKEEAEEIFWDNYNRRPRHHISKREMHILEMHILEVHMLGNRNLADRTRYSKKNIEKLAMAANNYAEFNDLWKAMDMAGKDRDGGTIPMDKGQLIDKILNERIDDRSRQLHRILEFYGQGFPMGFLNLLSEKEEELEAWKRAGIQLTNSGIYIQRNDRKKIYEQVEYADQLVQYAGRNPYKEAFRNRLREKEQQVADSYFYPIADGIIKPGSGQEDVRKVYENMYGRMVDILRDKSKGYIHLRSLLETELPTIIEKNNRLNGEEEQQDGERRQKQAELLYYLLRECPIQPKDSAGFLKMVRELGQKIAAGNHDEANALCSRLMLYQVQVIVISQQQETGEEKNHEKKQKEALELCNAALKLIHEYEKIHQDRKELIPKTVFMQQMQLYLLKSRVYGKLASIKEIERCNYRGEKDENYENICEAQKKYLGQMESVIRMAARCKKGREDMTKSFYKSLQAEIEYLRGEHYFKLSQFYEENKKYPYKKGDPRSRHRERKNFKVSAEYYGRALEFYQKYPGQYKLQAAGVMRSIADLYCRKKQSSVCRDKQECTDQFYKYIQDAYMYYRSYNNLHGIADVLQSMGEMEEYGEAQEKEQKSGICFYSASARLYRELGDEWSYYVVSAFLEGVRKPMECVPISSDC